MKNNNNWNKWAKYAGLGLLAVALLLWVVIPAAEIILGIAGNFMFDYIEKHPVGAFLVACIIGFIAYAMYHPKEEEIINPAWEPKPTESDYFAVLDTLRPAVAEVAEPLGLSPIYSHTDMAADAAERILPGNRVWGLKYKAPKKSVAIQIDEEKARRVIQAQVKTVLERDNPSKFTDIRHYYHGTFEPVIQIDEVADDDAFINIFVVMASDTYFKNREAEKRSNTLHIEADTNDTDF